MQSPEWSLNNSPPLDPDFKAMMTKIKISVKQPAEFGSLVRMTNQQIENLTSIVIELENKHQVSPKNHQLHQE